MVFEGYPIIILFLLNKCFHLLGKEDEAHLMSHD